MTDVLTTERQLVHGAKRSNLDTDLVRRHIKGAVEVRGYTGPTDPDEYLLWHRCLRETDQGVVPTVLGILAFSPDPERWLDQSGIDIAQFSSNSPNSTQRTFNVQLRGPLSDLINRAVDILWARSDHRIVLDKGTERIEEHAYDRVVLRELTVNALCHRDWAIEGAIVRIQLFPDWAEWITPGGLPPSVTVKNLRTAQMARNPSLAQILYHAGFVDRFGLGIDTVLDILEAAGSPPPFLQDVGEGDSRQFTFRVHKKPLVAADAAPQRSIKLTRRQNRIVELLGRQGLLSATEIADGLREPRRNIQRDLQVLAQHEVVVSTGVSVATRYRLNR